MGIQCKFHGPQQSVMLIPFSSIIYASRSPKAIPITRQHMIAVRFHWGIGPSRSQARRIWSTRPGFMTMMHAVALPHDRGLRS